MLGQTSRQEILQRLGTPYREGTVTKNGKQLQTMTYAFATSGGTPARAGVNPTRGQGFYFFDDKLSGIRLLRARGKRTRPISTPRKYRRSRKACRPATTSCELIGRPGGKYAYPLITDQKAQADVYLYAETSGGPFNAKFRQKHLVVTYDDRGVVSNVDYQEITQK